MLKMQLQLNYKEVQEKSFPPLNNRSINELLFIVT